MTPETILYIITAIVVANFIVDQVLDYLNFSTWKDTRPQELMPFYKEEEYQKAKAYHTDKFKLTRVSDVISFLMILLFLLSGGFGWLNEALIHYIEHPIWLALAYFGVLSLALSLLSLPFSYYNTFVIEEKYGFNKTSPALFFLDKVKGLILTIIIGGGIGYLILWLIFYFEADFWWMAWLAVTIFTVFVTAFYTTLFVPLFNKLRPLQNKNLKYKIEEYAQRVNFPLTNIMEIDGSKRSSKGNAFFSGFGKRKKIVLYDTLIEKHTDEELVAILAHEVGHYKKNHVIKGLITSIIQTGAVFYLLSLFIFSEELSTALGAEATYVHINLIAFSMLFEPISMLLKLFTNYTSRKHEYEADRFAAETYNKQAFETGLTKLSTHHLSNLTPHPAYVFFHYSHPTLLQRLNALKENQ